MPKHYYYVDVIGVIHLLHLHNIHVSGKLPKHFVRNCNVPQSAVQRNCTIPKFLVLTQSPQFQAKHIHSSHD